MSADAHRLTTQLIHAGDAANPTTAVSAPIYQSATFRFDAPEAIAAAMTSEAHPLFYGRYATPNTQQVEATLAKLEGGEAALAVASGMAAVSQTLLTFLNAGDHLIAQKALYPTTYRLLNEMLPRLGITATFVDQTDVVAFAAAIQPNTKLIYTESPANPTLSLNNRLPPLDDVRVRQALAYALDREKLVNIFWRDSGLLAAGALPPGLPGYGGATEPLPFDPARARALLAEAGYADPADLGALTYYTAGYDTVGGLVTAVITLWQETLGINIEPVLIDPYTYNEQLYAGDIGHFFASGWCADYPDPQNFLDILYHSGSGQNLSGYANAQVDDLLEQARVERDTAARLALYAQVEQQLVADVPVIFLAHGVTAVLVKPRVQNYVLTPLGVAQWDQVWLEE